MKELIEDNYLGCSVRTNGDYFLTHWLDFRVSQEMQRELGFRLNGPGFLNLVGNEKIAKVLTSGEIQIYRKRDSPISSHMFLFIDRRGTS